MRQSTCAYTYNVNKLRKNVTLYTTNHEQNCTNCSNRYIWKYCRVYFNTQCLFLQWTKIFNTVLLNLTSFNSFRCIYSFCLTTDEWNQQKHSFFDCCLVLSDAITQYYQTQFGEAQLTKRRYLCNCRSVSPSLICIDESHFLFADRLCLCLIVRWDRVFVCAPTTKRFNPSKSPLSPFHPSVCICPSHKENKHRRPWALDTNVSRGWFDQNAADVCSYLSVKACKQYAAVEKPCNKGRLPNWRLSQQSDLLRQSLDDFQHYWLKCGLDGLDCPSYCRFWHLPNHSDLTQTLEVRWRHYADDTDLHLGVLCPFQWLIHTLNCLTCQQDGRYRVVVHGIPRIALTVNEALVQEWLLRCWWQNWNADESVFNRTLHHCKLRNLQQVEHTIKNGAVLSVS